MTAHAPDPQDPVQIIASFFRGNWDMPEKFATGLIEELASEGWIITRAQVFNDMLEALNAIRVWMKNIDRSVHEQRIYDALRIVIAKAEGLA